MLKIKLSYLACCLLLMLATLIFIVPEKVTAACNTSSTVGSVTMSASVPISGEYVVWVRMYQASPSNDALRVELDGSCFEVGSSSAPANTWVWVNYSGANEDNKMRHSFGSGGTKTAKVLSTKYGVYVDRVILLGNSEQCSSNGDTPVGNGNNCNSAPASPSPGGGSTGPYLPPVNPGESSPILPGIVASQPENVDKVEYYINGELVQTSYGAEPLNTNELPEGDYSLTTKVTYKDGTTAESQDNISVERDNSPSAALKTWVKQRRIALLVGSSIFLALCLSVAGIMIYRYMRHRKIYYQTHWVKKP